MVDPVLTPLVVAGAAWLGKALTSDPVTDAATSVATNLASSQLLDPVCRRVRGALGARMSGADGSLPRNHDVERAVRTAQMQASRALIADFAARASNRNVQSDLSFARTAATWVETQYSAIGRLEVSDAVREATIAAIDPSLSDRAAVASDDVLRDQAQTAAAAALTELEAATGGPAPEAFRARFLSPDAGDRSWFDAFGAFLAEQVKTNDAFRSILSAARLAEIGAGVRRIEDMADQWTAVAEGLRRTVDEQLALLRGIKDDTSAIRGTLDDPEFGLRALHEQIQALAIARGGSAADVEALRAERDQLKAHGEIKDRAYEGFLAILSEQPIPPEQWAAQLATFAQRYQALLAESRTRTNLPHDLETERRRAETAIEAGDLDGADAALAALSDRMAEQREQAGREEAKIRARRAEIAKTQLRYHDAADLFGQAAALEPQTDHDAVWRRLMDQASVFGDQGREFGDNAACEKAIRTCKQASTFVDRQRVPLDWAMTQNNLGNALSTLGERESGTARLEEAVEAYRAALEEWTRERVPLDWALTQNNLGTALSTLGERESGTARLEEAVQAYRAALEERTRERVPLDWATTQNNLGNALSTLGERESGTARLDEAVAAYSAALLEQTRERVPLDWAGAQNNLGNALVTLGGRESGTAHLNEAVTALSAALLEWTRERVPLDWAMTQNNLGNALAILGQRESGTLRLDEAVEAFREALLERIRERVPRDWAATRYNQALVFGALHSRTGNRSWLEEAIEAVSDALEVFETAGSDYQAELARTLLNLLLAKRDG